MLFRTIYLWSNIVLYIVFSTQTRVFYDHNNTEIQNDKSKPWDFLLEIQNPKFRFVEFSENRDLILITITARDVCLRVVRPFT